MKLDKRIILVGKAASGKDYFKDFLIERGFIPSVSHTTRPMRDGEIDLTIISVWYCNDGPLLEKSTPPLLDALIIANEDTEAPKILSGKIIFIYELEMICVT